MKYRDPKTGDVFEGIQQAQEKFCPNTLCKDKPYEVLAKNCALCRINMRSNGWREPCEVFCDDHPAEAAHLMGYEVIDDSSSDSSTEIDDTPTDTPTASDDTPTKEDNMGKKNKAAMWKVEDKAVIIGNHNKHQFAIGETVELVSVYGRSIWKCKNDIRNTWLVREEDMRPLTEEEQEADTDINVTDKPLSEWTLGEVKALCEKQSVDGCCYKCPFSNIIGNCTLRVLPEEWDMEDTPRLTEAELEICWAVGAKWVSRDDLVDSDAVLWDDKPNRVIGNSYYYPPNGKKRIARIRCDIFPSVNPGDLIEVGEEE